MKKNILAEQVFELVFSRLLECRPDPAIFGRVQMAADGEIITPGEQLLQFGMAQHRVATTQRAAHRLDREQAIDRGVEQGCERQIGIILAIPVRVTQQAVEVGIALLILRHQHQRILQDQR